MASRILLETQFFPTVQWMSKLLVFDEIFLEAWEHYQKGSYRNRCHLASPNGLVRLTVPLRKGKNEQMPIREVQIAYDEPWQKKYWQAIRTNYQRAPFFEHFEEELAPLFERKFHFLFDLNWSSLEVLCRLGNLPFSKIKLTEVYMESADFQGVDFRNVIHPKAKNQVSDPYFQSKKYPQIFEEKTGFMPNLSCLDLLLSMGNRSADYLK